MSRFWREAVARLGIALLLTAGLTHAVPAQSILDIANGPAPWWVLRGTVPPFADLDFANGRYWQQGLAQGRSPGNLITVSRASTGTNLLPTSASGFAYATFGNNVARITPGSGLLAEESRTNQLLNSAAPATQTTGSLGTATYTLWVNGSGTATMSAGTATGCGTGAATNGTPVNFTITVAGTCTVTVSGSLNAFQLEAGSFGLSFIPTTGATVTRAGDVITLTTIPTFGNSYTLFGAGTPNSPNGFASNQYLLIPNDNNVFNNYAAILRATTTDVASMRFSNSGSPTQTGAGGTWSSGAAGKLSAAFGATSAASFNGASPLTSSATITSGGNLTIVNIGGSGNAGFWNGIVSRVAIWPGTNQPSAIVQKLTQ